MNALAGVFSVCNNIAPSVKHFRRTLHINKMIKWVMNYA